MLLAVRAWRLRESARKELAAGDPLSALEFVEEAQNTHSTAAGRALQVLSRWLIADS